MEGYALAVIEEKQRRIREKTEFLQQEKKERRSRHARGMGSITQRNLNHYNGTLPLEPIMEQKTRGDQDASKSPVA